jgi:hypothetical protein
VVLRLPGGLMTLFAPLKRLRLVLLRHKFICMRRAIEARQHGHSGKRLTRASMMRRRMVAIEFGT